MDSLFQATFLGWDKKTVGIFEGILDCQEYGHHLV